MLSRSTTESARPLASTEQFPGRESTSPGLESINPGLEARDAALPAQTSAGISVAPCNQGI